MKGIYIHIPFCKSKCYYCDFNSYSNRNDIVERYMNGLVEEIRLYGEQLSGSKTIFIGGGTPSAIDSKYIVGILEEIYKYSKREDFIEITIEVNPGTIDEKKLKDYESYGINRISMGVQSLNDKVLKGIGRTHDRETVYKSVELARKYFDNISIDMIFGLPNQDLDILKADIEDSTELGLKHISFYALKIEEGTELYRQKELGQLRLPDEETEREMYHEGIEILKSKGYHQYEISNFAKHGYNSKHNLIYWNVEPYIGLGLSASSNINGKRYSNTGDFYEYFEKIEAGKFPVDQSTVETIDREEEISEYCILKLRLSEGIRKEEFQRRFGVRIEDIYRTAIDKHVSGGLIVENSHSIKLTDKGLDLANQVYMDFLI